MRDPDWKKWESDVAFMVDGDVVYASGSTDKFKGDVKTPEVLIDCKFTESSGYRLTDSMWKKLSLWARNESREPVVAVRVKGHRGCEVAVMDELFYDLISGIDTSSSEAPNEIGAKGRVIGYRMDMRPPTVIWIGRRRLVACSMESFAEMLWEWRSKSEDK